jgi:CRISPR-associated protein Csm3
MIVLGTVMRGWTFNAISVSFSVQLKLCSGVRFCRYGSKKAVLMVFEKLEKRFILEGVIETVTPLHIGSGKGDREMGEPDMPVILAPGGEPYIPGSSLKGRTRAEVERLAKCVELFGCIPPDTRTMCGSRRSPGGFCPACRIFGTAGTVSVAGKVKFRDAYPVAPIGELLERTGIAIDRRTGTVDPKMRALYVVEAVPRGSQFRLEIVLENMTEDELKLFKAALRSVEWSSLGGSSAKGFGKIQFQFKRLREHSTQFYLGKEPEVVVEGAELEKWLKG